MKLIRKIRSTRSGFTLLEIMLVVMIIALLAGLAIWSMGGQFGVAQETKVKADLTGFHTNFMMYQVSNGSYPTTEQGIKALNQKPGGDPAPRSWRQLLKEIPKDPWGMDYHYAYPGSHDPTGYDLWSAGPNRISGDADDIGNWKREG